MRKLVTLAIGAVAVTVLWYGTWRYLMSDDVARIRGTIAYQNQQFKSAYPYIVLKSDGVYATGFPFHFHVAVNRLTLSMIEDKKTFAISIPKVEFQRTHRDQGRYRMIVPQTVEALYAENGSAPENYRVTIDKAPNVLLRAQSDSQQCSDLPGQTHCAPVAVNAPLISVAAEIPATVTLHMELNGEARDADFHFAPISIPVFQPIPKNINGTLELFVSVLREALIYKTP